jgi:hypothetical protein
MMMTLIKCIPPASVSLLAMFGSFSYAHHSVGTHFDESRSIEVRGTVTEFKLRSPHATLVLDGFQFIDGIPQGNEEQRWEIESISLPGLRRMGVDNDTFQSGDMVTVIGSPHRKENFRFVHSSTFITGDGREFRLKRQGSEEAPLSERVSKTAGVYRLTGRWRGPLSRVPEKSPMPLNEAGLAAWRDFDPKQSPANTCEPVSIPNAFHTPYLFDIEFIDSGVVLRNQVYDISRNIPLNGEFMPTQPQGIFGQVRGVIDGDSLVVESRNYPPSRWGLAAATTVPGAGADVPSSEAKTVVENYSVSEDGQKLIVSYKLNDPGYLSETYSGLVELIRVAGLVLQGAGRRVVTISRLARD